MNMQNPKIYLRAMGLFWALIGVMNIANPGSMDSFLSETGLQVSNEFSDHAFFHGGMDIVAWAIILFALSFETLSKRMILIVGCSALAPTAAIVYSVVFTPYWTAMFLVTGSMAFGFFLWGLFVHSRIQIADA